MGLPFELIISNDTKVAMLWNLFYRRWLQQKIKRRHTTLMLLSSFYYHAFSCFFSSGSSNIMLAEHLSDTSWRHVCSCVLMAATVFPAVAERRVIVQHITINISWRNTQREIIYVNTEERRPQHRPLWNAYMDRALRKIVSSDKRFLFAFAEVWLKKLNGTVA